MMNLFIDFFDTIVHRSIPPEDVKKLWAKQLASMLSITSDIYKLRFRIEAALCAESFAKYQENEFKYTKMCQQLFSIISDDIKLKFDDFLRIARELELNIEQQVQYLDQENLDFLTKAKSQGSSIYLVSDFYFDKEFFENILKYHKINHLFDDLFISCEYNASKRSGKLYEVIKQKLKLKNFGTAIMIGDNQLADVTNASTAGLTPKWNNATIHHRYYQNIEPNEQIKNIITKFNAIYNTPDKLIYPEIALVLHLFIIKLYDILDARKIKDVLFMAREGEFLKKLFDQHTKLVGGKINSHYFYVSRRSTFLPSLSVLDEEDFHALFRQYINISPLEFLLNLNFDDNQISKLVPNFEFDLSTRINNLPNSPEFRQLLSNHLFAQFYHTNREEQIDAFNQHLDNMKIDKLHLHIVDIGWKGSIQDNLANILKASQISGYYLGLNATGRENQRSTKEGLLFNPESAWDSSTIDCAYNECTSIFEVILGASHGSTQKYSTSGEPVLLKNNIETSLFENTIKPLQDQIVEYIRLVDGIFAWADAKYADVEHFIGLQYASFIFSPTIKQLKLYNDLYHVESFGVHETTKFIEKQYNVLAALKTFLRNPKIYIRSAFWPAQRLTVEKLGFLKPLYKTYRLRKIIK